MKGILLFFWEVVKIVVLALVIVAPIRYFLFQPFIVKGASMSPAFHNGDYLIVDEISYRFREPKRGEVVVFKYPPIPSQKFIKRIIGLPGEEVLLENGRITIINQAGEKMVLDESSYLLSPPIGTGRSKILLKENEYFVLGDNRAHSFDSRKWGGLPRKYIVGRVIFRAWPPKAIAYILAPSY